MREAQHLGGGNKGDRSGEEDSGLFCKRSHCTFSLVLVSSATTCMETCTLESIANPLEKPGALLLSTGLGNVPWVALLPVSGNINAVS